MAKRRVAVVFVHGLAKKPPPAKLAELWAWGQRRDNPMPNVCAAPNPGIALNTAGGPPSFFPPAPPAPPPV
jgi:hypothetical protein